MNFLSWKAFWELIRYDLFVGGSTFAEIHDLARTIPIAVRTPEPGDAERICSAIEWASIWYGKRVMCLQRSFIAVRMLRHKGIDGRMVIGAQRLPFRAHAWVEVGGLVVNDRTSVQQRYTVLERC